MRVFPAALRRHGCVRSLDYLKQCLLHAFARNVSCYRYVLGLLRYLVDLVDIDDPALRPLDVVIRSLDYLEKDIFNVLTDISGLGKCRRISNGKRHVDYLCKRLCK